MIFDRFDYSFLAERRKSSRTASFPGRFYLQAITRSFDFAAIEINVRPLQYRLSFHCYSGTGKSSDMRIAKGLHAAVVGVSAGQAGSVEWARTREIRTYIKTHCAFMGHDGSISARGPQQQRSESSSFSRCKSLRRCRAVNPPFMSVAPVPEFIGHLAVDNLATTTLKSSSRWSPGWKKPLETLEGSDGSLPHRVALNLDLEIKSRNTREKRYSAAKTWAHYDLTASFQEWYGVRIVFLSAYIWWSLGLQWKSPLGDGNEEHKRASWRYT